ncbi:class I SAM-dependent methyltransferase [Nonomuraea jiangxiensis]|uniref:Methyltransferase domain-containing protein n=1 Tax=Nonomuraea jiangxiensis TaxID=633440 RepID=A0A1G8DJL7_9ACTN|nr:class I SAM-dependent methyltransferase [Nonomuraea jiangxiensis]SDH57878.1 Methyltransferase domain-containing protein [Nonomuraea jiangxiensis]
MVDRVRSVVFGEAVEQYESARPGYPEQLVTEVLEYAPAGPVLEVGAGTGKATVGFAAHGVDLTCVEPDPRMAAALTSKCPGVRVESGRFEDYVPDRPFTLLYSAQAWHWVDPERRWDLAHAALAPSGALALFWNRYVVTDAELGAALAAVDHRHGVTSSSLHRSTSVQAEESEHLLAHDPRFTDLDIRHYVHHTWYPTERYLDLVRSISAYRMLDPAAREPVLGELAALLGDGVEIAFRTDLTLARRAH